MHIEIAKCQWTPTIIDPSSDICQQPFTSYQSPLASHSIATCSTSSDSLLQFYTRSLTANGLQLDRPSPTDFCSNSVEIRPVYSSF
ncbi:hypothetical protein MA16_Dca012712 [Dendrobium catenatum]|uniref:Uncharacterized protein n=1 Tax=Dendrobium catenatum TaxID=906689 RepID=A0A2I0WPQ1_9ASPA|nr:hypothetical protein MA16_Dca012712 [Dendrobium catenatum]